MFLNYYRQKKLEDNLIVVTQNLIYLLKLPISSNTIRKELRNHREYPALSALSDSLIKWNIPHLCIELPKEKLEEVNLPAIAHFNYENGYMVILLKISSEKIIYLDPALGKVTEKKTSFFEKWSGVLLLVESNPYSGELNFKRNRLESFKYKSGKWLFIFLCLGSLLLINVSNFSLFTFSFFLIKLLGIGIASLLLQREFGEVNYLTDKICSITPKMSCDTVLDSNGAKFLKILTLSELSALYFIGSFLILVITYLGNYIQEGILLISILTFIATPFTFFSIYYQGIQLKKWCILCLGILLLIWTEIALISFLPLQIVSFSILKSLIILLNCFGFPLAFWLLLKPKLQEAKERIYYKKQSQNLKNNPSFFKATLKQIPLNREFYDEFSLGGLSKKNELIVVLSFFCRACKYTLKELYALISMVEPINIKLRFVLEEHDDSSIEIFKILLYLKNEKGLDNSLEALAKWYEIGDLNQWKAAYKIPKLYTQNYIDKVQQYVTWYNMSDIRYTPAFIWNTKLVFSDFSIQDIKHHLYKTYSSI